MDVFEAMETCRAMRYLKPDPVPEDTIRKLIHAATRASSPRNSQPWAFVVLRDPDVKARLGEALREVMSPVIEGIAAKESDPVVQRTYTGVSRLLETFERVPVYIFVCGVSDGRDAELVGAAVYPAAQNLSVPARSLGLGTTFTTFHTLIESTVRTELGLPDEESLGVMVALGWPERAFGPVRRRPLDDVLHWDRW